MKLAILGSRGIPNNYGGFEQFATQLSADLADEEFEVWVYSPHDHPYGNDRWGRVSIIHCYSPEYLIGQAGQYVYDFNCIVDARRRGFDLILQLGYTSNSVWKWLLPKRSLVVTNMDGLEWKRSKYNPLVRKFLILAEKWAVESSHCLVADSVAIHQYLVQKYARPVVFIPYSAAAFLPQNEHPALLPGLKSGGYLLLIARLQADNSIEAIIRGVLLAGTDLPLVVIGDFNHRYGRRLKRKFGSSAVRFEGAIYEQALLNELRYHSRFYFHGHTAGGTNPSLLEAMACSARIIAHDNQFNLAVLGENAAYFTDSSDLAVTLAAEASNPDWPRRIENNLDSIRLNYSRKGVTHAYINLFRTLHIQKQADNVVST